MWHFPNFFHRVAQLVTITMYVSVVWLSTSCNAADHSVTTPHTIDPSAKFSPPQFTPNEVLVKFKAGVSPERIASILNDARADVITELQQGRLYHVRMLGDRSVESVITRLTSYGEVEYAEPNYRHEMQK